MNQVLILTKNTLAEQEMQQKLQTLNFEVYTSTKLFEYCNQRLEVLGFFEYFQYVFLSETICESEIMRIVPIFKETSISVIRKVKTKATEAEHHYLETELLNAIISNDDSVDELRECLYKLKNQNESERQYHTNGKYIQLSDKVSLIPSNPFQVQDKEKAAEENYRLLEAVNHLSSTEARILDILVRADGGTVTRETLCYQIWGEEISNSHLASLSSTISRIKSKFENTKVTSKAIHTFWGKGYCISTDLLNRINQTDNFKVVVSRE